MFRAFAGRCRRRACADAPAPGSQAEEEEALLLVSEELAAEEKRLHEERERAAAAEAVRAPRSRRRRGRATHARATAVGPSAAAAPGACAARVGALSRAETLHRLAGLATPATALRPPDLRARAPAVVALRARARAQALGVAAARGGVRRAQPSFRRPPLTPARAAATPAGPGRGSAGRQALQAAGRAAQPDDAVLQVPDRADGLDGGGASLAAPHAPRRASGRDRATPAAPSLTWLSRDAGAGRRRRRRGAQRACGGRGRQAPRVWRQGWRQESQAGRRGAQPDQGAAAAVRGRDARLPGACRAALREVAHRSWWSPFAPARR